MSKNKFPLKVRKSGLPRLKLKKNETLNPSTRVRLVFKRAVFVSPDTGAFSRGSQTNRSALLRILALVLIGTGQGF